MCPDGRLDVYPELYRPSVRRDMQTYITTDGYSFNLEVPTNGSWTVYTDELFIGIFVVILSNMCRYRWVVV
jgi:hypothetical protein